MPGLFTPSPQAGRLLVDGALVNPVPVTLARAMGADFVIAVDMSSSLVGQFMRGAVREATKMPNLAEVIVGSLNIMSVRTTRSRMAGEPADAVIRPRLSDLGLLEYHRGEEAIAEGRAAADLAIPQIRRALQDWN
jgi:NTE family protein